MGLLLTKTKYLLLAGIVILWAWLTPNLVHSVPSKPSAPNISVQYQPYPISGSTAAQLREQMNQLGPTGPDGRNFDGLTQWYVRWVYQYDVQPNYCRITTVNVNLTVTFTMPQWQPPPRVSPELKTQWQRYMANLQTHENGHRNHGVDAANQILKALQALPSKPTCSLLATGANATAMAIIADYSRKDVEYDRLTNHGATQGARFP